MRAKPSSWVVALAGVGIVAASPGCSSEAPSLLGPGPTPTASGSAEDASTGDAAVADALAPPLAADAGPKDSGGAPPVGNGAQDLCVAEINKWRATEGLPPLARWTEAETCVDGQCKSDSETGKAHGAFGKCGEQAQNECPGWPGKPETMIAGCLKMMWDEKFGTGEKGHYINMKNTRYTKVSCGFYVTPAGKVWAIQNFRP
jgi:hypothetical protein